MGPHFEVVCRCQGTVREQFVQYTVCVALGVEATIRAMAAPQWEVRNSASIVFTALIVRTVGFKNVLKVCTFFNASLMDFLHHGKNKAYITAVSLSCLPLRSLKL